MNITQDTPLHKLFFKIMINISCFLRLKREIYVLMLRNMRGYMVCLFIFFLDFINTEKIRLKTGSLKYGRDTPSPTFRSISVFFRKYRNGQNKYRNTGVT